MKVVEVHNEKGWNDARTIREEVFVKEQHVPLELEIDEYDKTSFHFVLYDNEDTPIGAARLRLTNHVAKVERVCVLSSRRQAGSGRLLMEALEDKAQNEAASAMQLNAQVTAVPFYRKLGYEITSNEFMDAGIPHLEMKKALPGNHGS